MKQIQSISYKYYFIHLYISFLILFTTYELIESPDYLFKYINYLNFYSGNLNITNIERDIFFYQYLLSVIINNLIPVLNVYEVINLSFHIGNTILYLIGLLGIKKYLTQKEYCKNKIYLAMLVSNFMTAGLFLRLTFKPEILVVAFLPWMIINLDNFLRKVLSNVNVSILAIFDCFKPQYQ